MKQIFGVWRLLRWRISKTRRDAFNNILRWRMNRQKRLQWIQQGKEMKRRDPSWILKTYMPNVVIDDDASKMIRLTRKQLSKVSDKYKDGQIERITDCHIVLSQLLIDGAWIFSQPINKDKFILNIQKSLIKFPFLASIIQEYNENKCEILMNHNNTGIRLNIASFIASDKIHTNEEFEKEFHQTLKPGLRDQYFDLRITPRTIYANQDPLLTLQLTYFNDRENVKRIKDYKFKNYCVLSFQFQHGIGDAFSIYQYLKYLSYLNNLDTAMQIEGVETREELELSSKDKYKDIIQIGKEFDRWEPLLCDENPRHNKKFIKNSKFFKHDGDKQFRSRRHFKNFYDQLVKDQNTEAKEGTQAPISSVLPVAGIEGVVPPAPQGASGANNNNNSNKVPGIARRDKKNKASHLATFDTNYPNHPLIKAHEVSLTTKLMQQNVNSIFKYFSVRPPLFERGGWHDYCYELHLPASFLSELKTNIIVNGQGRGIDNITTLESIWAYFGFLFNKYLYDYELNHIFSNISLRDRYDTYDKQDFGNLITGMNVDLSPINKDFNKNRSNEDGSVHIFESFKEINYIVDMACIFRGYYNFFTRHGEGNKVPGLAYNAELSEQILQEWWYFNENVRNFLYKEGHYQLLLSTQEILDGKYVQFNEIKSLQMYKNYQFGVINGQTGQLCKHSWQYVYGTYYNANQFVVLPVSPRDPKGGFIVYIRFDNKLKAKWEANPECMELVTRYQREFGY